MDHKKVAKQRCEIFMFLHCFRSLIILVDLWYVFCTKGQMFLHPLEHTRCSLKLLWIMLGYHGSPSFATCGVSWSACSKNKSKERTNTIRQIRIILVSKFCFSLLLICWKHNCFNCCAYNIIYKMQNNVNLQTFAWLSSFLFKTKYYKNFFYVIKSNVIK